jgi:hypothetical protein
VWTSLLSAARQTFQLTDRPIRWPVRSKRWHFCLSHPPPGCGILLASERGSCAPRVVNKMTGRRRHVRYLLTETVEGSLRVREEVAIESRNEWQIVVLSSMPSRPDDSLTLELPGAGPRHVRVRVAESKPVVAPDGSLRYRLLLDVRDEAGRERQMP